MRLFKVQGRYIPADEPIDLLNVGFENPRKQAKQQDTNRKKRGKSKIESLQDLVLGPDASYLVPDRKTGLEGVAELRRLCPHRIWNFVGAAEAPCC